ncbi:hypothetical protein ACP70R_040093 [Stipagrostis hirtigluma subsp. patula]
MGSGGAAAGVGAAAADDASTAAQFLGRDEGAGRRRWDDRRRPFSPLRSRRQPKRSCFLAALRDVWAPAGEPVPPPPVQLELAQHQEQENVGDGAEEDGRGSGADDAEAEDMKAEQVKREGARRDAARDTRRAAATHVPDVAAGDDHRRRAPSTVGVVPIPKRARTAARVSGSARVSEDVFRAAVADLVAGGALGVAPTTGGSGAVSAAAAEVLIKISDVCQNVMLRSFDVEAEAAEAARCACAGRRP